MKNSALLQLGAELMFMFRHSQTAADRCIAEYVKARRFLGSQDKRFLTEAYYHTLRHLRRIDEAILSAFSGSIAVEARYSSGFPVTAEIGARAWIRGQKTEADGGELRQVAVDRIVDTIRLGVSAVELGFDNAATVGEELSRAWPRFPGRDPLAAGTLIRMTEQAVETARLYARPRRPVDADRAYSFPAWMWAMMAMGRDPKDAAALGEALNRQAPVTLRINPLKTTMDAAQAALREAAIEFSPVELCDSALSLNERQARGSLPHFQDGWFEMQDVGSQLISVYAGVEPGMKVADACAGGGGKSLHLAALMQNAGVVYTLDIDHDRLRNLSRRADRSGVRILNHAFRLGTHGELPAREDLAELDLVLIDAPCSGTGVLRRNPENKWRLTTPSLAELQETQRRLLDAWATRVRPGGLLVYATCSLLREENAAQTDAFLASHKDFSIDPPGKFHGPTTTRGELQTEPHRHGCDGFYAARMRRKE